MEIEARQVEGVLVISVAGSIDALTAEEFSGFLSELVDQGQHQFVMDLARLDFMSSAGLRGILHLLRDSRQQGGNLRLAAVQPGVTRVLELAGLPRIMDLYPAVDDAIASFST